MAQAPGMDFSAYNKENSNKPIDIESDRLEVDDKKQTALFIGNVSATQGDYNLKSRQLEVTYERSAQQAQKTGGAGKAVTATPAAASDPVTNGQIKFLKASGNVLVTSGKDEQQATGREGFFDVKAQKITLTGDVTLIQKKNRVSGEQLDIDLATGRAMIDPGKIASGGKKRVRAVFEREGGTGQVNLNPFAGKKKAQAPDIPKEAQKAPASEWRTESR